MTVSFWSQEFVVDPYPHHGNQLIAINDYREIDGKTITADKPRCNCRFIEVPSLRHRLCSHRRRQRNGVG